MRHQRRRTRCEPQWRTRYMRARLFRSNAVTIRPGCAHCANHGQRLSHFLALNLRRTIEVVAQIIGPGDLSVRWDYYRVSPARCLSLTVNGTYFSVSRGLRFTCYFAGSAFIMNTPYSHASIASENRMSSFTAIARTSSRRSCSAWASTSPTYVAHPTSPPINAVSLCCFNSSETPFLVIDS